MAQEACLIMKLAMPAPLFLRVIPPAGESSAASLRELCVKGGCQAVGYVERHENSTMPLALSEAEKSMRMASYIGAARMIALTAHKARQKG